MRREQLLVRWRSIQPGIDWLIAVALAGSWVANLAHNWDSFAGPSGDAGPAWAVAVVIPVTFLPLGVRRRFPLEVLATTLCGTLLLELVLSNPAQQGAIQDFLAWILVAYTAAAYESGVRYRLAAALTLAAAAIFVSVTLAAGQSAGNVLPAEFFVALAWVAGRAVHRRQRLVDTLAERTVELEREREQRARAAVEDERARIARELHDVVAHSVSVMVVQAQAGQRLLAEPELAGGAFRSIEASGREALVELRRLLGILRMADEELAIGPQPGLGSLDALLEQVRDAGLSVELRIEGEAEPLPPGVDLSAYRIVQEALTNTLKHAGNARAEVIVRYCSSTVELEVLDNGQGSTATVNGSGHGLTGMRERASLYGGTLEAGERREGGFAVRALLPLESSRS